jgi:hypothetical protein
VAPEIYAHAKERALEALVITGDRQAQDRLAVYYDLESDYVGASFVDLEPNKWFDITPTDLQATALMRVHFGPLATRRLTSPGENRRTVLRPFRAIPDRDLADADAGTLAAMESFYRAVKTTISSDTVDDPNPWVTASKLCARKRPHLFPVRDRNVCTHLGILKLDDFRADWQVFRALIRDDDIVKAVDALPALVREAGAGRLLAIDSSRLRLLDAAMWTYTTWY